MVRQNVINRRKELKITQDEISKVVGISRPSYAAIERGLRDPSLETAQRICQVLKMSVDEAFPLRGE